VAEVVEWGGKQFRWFFGSNWVGGGHEPQLQSSRDPSPMIRGSAIVEGGGQRMSSNGEGTRSRSIESERQGGMGIERWMRPAELWSKCRSSAKPTRRKMSTMSKRVLTLNCTKRNRREAGLVSRGYVDPSDWQRLERMERTVRRRERVKSRGKGSSHGENPGTRIVDSLHETGPYARASESIGTAMCSQL
jgi:hypothetical protein